MNLKEKINLIVKANEFFGDIYCFTLSSGDGRFDKDFIFNQASIEKKRLVFDVADILNTKEITLCAQYEIRNREILNNNLVLKDIQNLSLEDFEKKYSLLNKLLDYSLNVDYMRNVGNSFHIMKGKTPPSNGIDFIESVSEDEMELLDFLGFSFLNIPCPSNQEKELFELFDSKMKVPYKYLCSESFQNGVYSKYGYGSHKDISFFKNTILKNSKYEKEYQIYLKNINMIKENVNYGRRNTTISRVNKQFFSLQNYDKFELFFKLDTDKCIKSKKEIYLIMRKLNELYEKENIALFFEVASNNEIYEGKAWRFSFFCSKDIVEKNGFDNMKNQFREVFVEVLNHNPNTYKIDVKDLEKNFPKSFNLVKLFTPENNEENVVTEKKSVKKKI